MAKTSVKQREEKREKLVAKYAKKYAELKSTANDAKLTDEQRYAARLELQQLPRNAYPTRLRNRCALTGRGRGTFRYASSYTATSFSNPFRSAIRAPRPLRPPRNGVAEARQVDLSYARTRGGSGNTSNPSKWRT